MYLPISILAYLLNGIAVTVDKFLLNKIIPDPLFYIFYFSLVSCFAIFALPFTQIPTLETFILASISTVFWTLGAYFMFKALKIGQIQRVIPIIGTLNPLILFALTFAVLTQNELWAILILILGLILLTFSDWRGKFSSSEAIFEVLSATLFALSYLILKQAYGLSDVITVLVYSRFILIPLAIIFLIVPKFRQIFSFHASRGTPWRLKAGLLFTGGQISAGISQLLIFYAISLGNPALVNSLAGIQYVFLFILALILGKIYPQVFVADKGTQILFFKFLGIILIFVGLYLLTF